MRKIIFSFFSLLLFFTGMGNYFETYAAEGDTCEITRRDDGSISQVRGRCSVCAWNLADRKCEATDAGFEQWTGISACKAGSQPYSNNPAVCSGINEDDCKLAVGQCLLSEDTDPNIKYKWVGYTIDPEFGCVECTLEPPGQPDVAGDNNVCKWDTPNICEEESGPGLKYKCVSDKCTECSEGESGCKILSACKEECEKEKEDKPIITNTPLSLPCNPEGASYDEEKGCIRIKTALGNVSTEASGFTRWVLGFVLSIAGGIVILIIIISGYRLMTSQGDPEKVKNARDQLTAAIVGLLFIIFSLAILELITRDILGLPGFGS